MSSAQGWTLIGAFLAILVAMNALVLAVVRSEIGGLRGEIVARIEALDRDVQRLYDHVFHGRDS